MSNPNNVDEEMINQLNNPTQDLVRAQGALEGALYGTEAQIDYNEGDSDVEGQYMPADFEFNSAGEKEQSASSQAKINPIILDPSDAFADFNFPPLVVKKSKPKSGDCKGISKSIPQKESWGEESEEIQGHNFSYDSKGQIKIDKPRKSQGPTSVTKSSSKKEGKDNYRMIDIGTIPKHVLATASGPPNPHPCGDQEYMRRTIEDWCKKVTKSKIGKYLTTSWGIISTGIFTQCVNEISKTKVDDDLRSIDDKWGYILLGANMQSADQTREDCTNMMTNLSKLIAAMRVDSDGMNKRMEAAVTGMAQYQSTVQKEIESIIDTSSIVKSEMMGLIEKFKSETSISKRERRERTLIVPTIPSVKPTSRPQIIKTRFYDHQFQIVVNEDGTRVVHYKEGDHFYNFCLKDLMIKIFKTFTLKFLYIIRNRDLGRIPDLLPDVVTEENFLSVLQDLDSAENGDFSEKMYGLFQN